MILERGVLITYEYGVIGIIMGIQRCGHQYNRRWEYKIMQIDGQIKWWDEYELRSLKGFKIIDEKDEAS